MNELIESVARILAEDRGLDPDALEPGDLAPQPDWEEDKFQCGYYDEINVPDGDNGKDPCHYIWREYIFSAKKAIQAIQAIQDAGFCIVPKELPIEIIERNLSAWSDPHDFQALYKAMLEASRLDAAQD